MPSRMAPAAAEKIADNVAAAEQAARVAPPHLVASSVLYNSDDSCSSAAGSPCNDVNAPGAKSKLSQSTAYPPSPENCSPERADDRGAAVPAISCSPEDWDNRGTKTNSPTEESEAAFPAEHRNHESAAEVFARAEALCEAQQFVEAAELFRCVLAALRTSPERHALRAVEAEVWAHLGVAMQSLDDIDAAIESYGHAVRLDPSLHVCFANLATLHVYLAEFKKAQDCISKALSLDPRNEAYLDIQKKLKADAGP